MGKGQVSVEYLIIIAIAIGLLVPAVLFFYIYSKSATGESTGAQLNEIGLQIISTVKSTYALGVNARQTLEFTMPEEVERVYVNGTEMVFVYNTPQGLSEAVFFSTIGMRIMLPTGVQSTSGNISVARPGHTRYRFTSLGQEVLITEAT